MIELDGVTKTYGTERALGPVSLQVRAGETTVLLGPSGCGKSTLLRLLLGLVWPEAGRIVVEGIELTPGTVRDMRLRTGYVIQEGGLFPHLSARENVALMPRHLGWDDARLDARIADLAALVQLPEALLVRRPGALSGGQRQRVALMRALVLDPDVLLLDEPLGALDPMIRADLQDELAAIFERLGKTVVLVTHDLAEAALLGHRIVLLEDGRVAQDGAFRDLVRSPASEFVARFVAAQRGAPAA